jgi:thiol-disulfide isomerase/thioredoxin
MRWIRLVFLGLIFSASTAVAQGGDNLPPWQTASKFEAGKTYIVVQAWASWCASCSKILPMIHDSVRERSDVQFLTVSIDDEAEDARGYLRKHSGTFVDRHIAASLDLGGRSLADYGVKTVPATLVFRGPGDTKPMIIYGFEKASIMKALSNSH